MKASILPVVATVVTLAGCGDDDTGVITKIESSSTAKKIQEACGNGRVVDLESENHARYGGTSAWMVVCTTGEIRRVIDDG